MGGGGGGGRSRTEAIMREIERLRAEREELDGSIRLFESQLAPHRRHASPSLSAKAEAMGLPPAAVGLTPDTINRYSRHLLLPDFGIEGQRRLSQSSILVVGAGGLGSPVAMYLAACGVGCLGIVDGDDVELGNLHRQVSTVDGTSELRIPPGTQPGDVVVLAKQGVPTLNRPSIRGNHLFTIKVTIPNRISGRERELLEELASLSNGGFARAPVKPKSIREGNKSSVGQEDSSQRQSDGEGDWLKKLKDFAGSIANGAAKWLKDNL